jgi:VWFA-related protein
MLIMGREASRGRSPRRRGPAVAAALLALAGTAATIVGPAPARGDDAAAAASAAEAAAQDPSGQFQEEFMVSWILVPVLVKSRKGYVEGLDREDFELRVDGRSVRFQDFEQRGEAPWSLVFMQDLSGSMGVGGRLEASLEAIRYFFERARPGDEYALSSFASGVTAVDVPFTEDLDVLRDGISKWEAYGKTTLHDAVGWLPEISGDSRNVKRAAVLITDGVDNASKISAGEARELVRRAELPVYVLGLESGDPMALDAAGEKVYRYADVLNLLAALTGGRYFPIQGPDDMKEACATIADELRYQYVLGFDTQASGRPAWHDLSVLVKHRNAPDLRVIARKGYRGTPPAR